MSLMLRSLVAIAAVGALTMSATDAGNQTTRRRAGSPTPVASVPSIPTQADFTTAQLEYYLNDDGIAYIRPGVKVKLISFTNVEAGKKPVAEITITDNFDQPLDRNGKITPGPIAPGFILSRWDAAKRTYIALTTRVRSGVTQPSGDQNGTWTDLEMGHYKYTFGTTLPANFDATATYTLGIYARRTLSDIIGKDYYADNIYKDFRPDGQAAGAVWAAMDTSKSCNNCHNPLGLHGGTRRDVKNCVLCHNEGASLSSGNSINAEVFFHKLHMSENLPSVKAGTPYIVANADFSHITYPQDIRNCTTCHETSAPEKDIWYTRPSRSACGSCHDDVDFATGKNHVAGAMADDSKCASCHVPDSGNEFDASIKGAHTIPLKSKQIRGITAVIDSVSNVAPGKNPTVVFKLTNTDDKSAIDGTKLSTFSPMLAGNTASYYKYFREDARAKAVFDAAKGTTTYTFTNAIPADATGTWAVSADIYRTVSIKRADGGADITGLRDAALNPVKYVSTTTDAAVARRQVVDMNLCNKCHANLALHGDQRKNIDECVMCHNPLESDVSRRPAAAGKPESVSFQRMIHRIHAGEEMLTQDFTIYGFGGSKNNFNEVTFPGDLKDCAKCHVNNSHRLPAPTTAGPVTTERDYFSPQGPGTAACLGCHDSRDAAAHAYLNTTTFGGQPAEACGTCHGTNADWSVDKSHAR